MDLIISNLQIPVEKDGVDEYIKAASEKLETCESALRFVKMLNKSLDLRNKDQFFYDVSVVVSVPDSFDNKENFPPYTVRKETARKPKNIKERPIIIGFGPAGIFAALELIEYGLKPLIFERGRKIEDRDIDVQRFIKERKLDMESNIQFGEGGAGSYSDGKLFSRTNNTEHANRVLDTFIKFGAPEEIGYVGKPHLGTDVLCKIVRNMRSHILERGGEIHYSSKMTDMLISDGKVSGVVINGEKEYCSSHIYLAIGHSARDTFEMIHKKGVSIEQKPISVGVRIEHPAEIINLIRHGRYKDFPGIGAATYSFTFTNRKTGRGVYTFCMCPGGEVVNASSENGMMAVNGMSYSGRSSAFSNSALVVTCHTDDYKSASPLAGIEFQKDIERKAFAAAGGKWEVPAQNLEDFLCGRPSSRLNDNSYRMGAASVDMNAVFPEFVCGSLLFAFNKWKEDYPLFVSEHAILMAAETRTSSPIKIKRSANYESVNVENLYPIGEGSGYTGGITSSATDAIKAVERSVA
ncbi:MAG TPA: dehydrogenase [Lentisphaeria bacterium]|nr:MAG: dehydrogenase [Lentisphaerae bacterium GWF2_49_21]HBC87435.1 dehydrogenase [Lentisphaeria bacterium]